MDELATFCCHSAEQYLFDAGDFSGQLLVKDDNPDNAGSAGEQDVFR
jgi:hypothetical protein